MRVFRGHNRRRYMSPNRSCMLAIGVLVAATIPESGWAQGITVTGLVVERTRSSWIGGATVPLSGSPLFFTDLDGTFRFTGVTPGRHTLFVEAMGYQTRSQEMVIRADTAFTVEMDPDPIRLDSLLVRAGNITIRGEILDASTGQRVLFAQVTVQPDFSTVGAISGHFTVRRVPVGRAVTVLVEAVEFLPARIALITEADTSLTVEMEPDPVGIRMVAEQAQKLEARSRGQPYRRRVLGEDRLALLPSWTMYEVGSRELKMSKRSWNRGGVRGGRPSGPGEVARVEIYDDGGMVRIYTKRYLVSLLGKEPGPMFYTPLVQTILNSRAPGR